MAIQAATKGENKSMAFNSLKQTHEKLFQNPEISEHNKEFLDEFFENFDAIQYFSFHIPDASEFFFQ